MTLVFSNNCKLILKRMNCYCTSIFYKLENNNVVCVKNTTFKFKNCVVTCKLKAAHLSIAMCYTKLWEKIITTVYKRIRAKK